ncbi:MAG: tyrosine-type recombinase/integrase [Patescibacteria group bacterium]|jgi:site-specific recombinase XerD
MPALLKFREYLSISRGLKKSTVDKHLELLSRLRREVRPFTSKNTLSFLVSLKDTKSIGYVNRLLLTARIWGEFVGDSEFKTLKKFKEQKGVIRKSILSEDEINKILDMPCKFCNKSRWRLLTFAFKVLAFTGLRPIELCNLKLVNVNFGTGCFEILNDKTGKNRYVPIPENLKWSVRHYAEKGQVYLLEKPNRHPFTTEDLSENFRKRVRRLRIKRNVSLYSLRHSIATRLLDTDQISVYKVQKLLGHNDLQTTAIYTHLTHKDVKKALLKDPLNKGSEPIEDVFQTIIESIQAYLSGDRRLSLSYSLNGSRLQIEVDARRANI